MHIQATEGRKDVSKFQVVWVIAIFTVRKCLYEMVRSRLPLMLYLMLLLG